MVANSDAESTVSALNVMSEEKGRKSVKKGKTTVAVLSVYTILLIFVFVGCATSGVFVGIIVTSPDIRINYDFKADTTGRFSIQREGSGVVVAAQIPVTLPLDTPSIFRLTYKVLDIDLYWLPIGTSAGCLLRHGGLTSNASQGVLRYRSRFSKDKGTDTNFLSGSLTADVVRRTIGSSVAVMNFSWNIGLTIPAGRLDEAKPMYLDCKNHGKVLLTSNIQSSVASSPITSVATKGTIQSVLLVDCSVEGNVDAIMSSVTPMMKSVIFEGISNNPSTAI